VLQARFRSCNVSTLLVAAAAACVVHKQHNTQTGSLFPIQTPIVCLYFSSSIGSLSAAAANGQSKKLFNYSEAFRDWHFWLCLKRTYTFWLLLPSVLPRLMSFGHSWSDTLKAAEQHRVPLYLTLWLALAEECSPAQQASGWPIVAPQMANFFPLPLFA